MSDQREGLIMLIIANLGYAFLPIFTGGIYAASSLTPTDIAIWRFIFATPFIWMIIAFREQSNPKLKAIGQQPMPKWRLMSLGSLYAVAAVSAFAGLQYIPASTFVVLFYTYPAMVAIIGLFLGVRLSKMGWLALILTTIGVILTVPDFSLSGENFMLGFIIAMINALAVAIYFLMLNRVMRGVTAYGRSSAFVITGTLFFVSLTIIFFGLRVPPNLQTWGMLIGLAIVSTCMPIFLVNIGIQKLGAGRAAIVSASEPLFAIILSILLLGESLLPLQWVGAIIIVAAVVLLEATPRRKPKSENIG